MYIVKCDKKIIYDPEIPELALLEPKVTLELSNAGSFEFKMPLTHPAYESIKMFKSYIEVFNDNELIFAGRAIEERYDYQKSKQIYCEGELAYLNDSIQRPGEYHDISIRDFMQILLSNHNSRTEYESFQVGTVTVTDNNDSLYRYTNYENTLTALKEKLVDELGGYLIVRHQDGQRYLDYLAELPDTCSQTIEFGENLIDYASNIDTTNIATMLIPLGATLENSRYTAIDERLTIASVNSGLDFISACDECTDKYGLITKIQTWDDVTNPSNLLRKGREYLESVQWENLIINITAVDMHTLNPEIESINVGDNVLVVAKPYGINSYFPVSKMTIDLLNPQSNRITLGKNIDVSISAQSNATQREAATASKFSASSVLNNAKANASSMIKTATNGYIVLNNNANGKPKEILIMDTESIETAQKVWRWNANGLGYSSTGYDGEYGLAMTMDGGIVADFINAGILQGIKIIANNGSVGGWTITDTAMYSDFMHSDGYMRRVYVQSPHREDAWIFSIQKAQTQGENPKDFNAIYYVDLDGKIATFDDVLGKDLVANNDLRVYRNATIDGNATINGKVYANNYSGMAARPCMTCQKAVTMYLEDEGYFSVYADEQYVGKLTIQ